MDSSVTFTPVSKTSSAAANRLSRAFLSGPGDLSNFTYNDVGDGLHDDNDDLDLDDDDDDDDSGAEDPSKYKLEIRIKKPSSADETLSLSNETLWDIFDLVFECENYHSPSKNVYTPEFRKSMKHQYNLSRNDIFDAANPKFVRLWNALSTPAATGEARLAASLIPALSSASRITEDKDASASDAKSVTRAVSSWLTEVVAPQLSSLWVDLLAEPLDDTYVTRNKAPKGVPTTKFMSELTHETEFLESINRDAARRKKLMDSVVIDLASIVAIGSSTSPGSASSSSSNSAGSAEPNSSLTTMGPLLAAKMVSDTLPIAHISKFIPHLARFAYAKHIVRLNALLTQQIKDAIVDNVPGLPEQLERGMNISSDFEALTTLYSRFLNEDEMFALPKRMSVSSSTHPEAGHAAAGSSTGATGPNRYSISFFPNTHRRTLSYSSNHSAPGGSSAPSTAGGVRTPSLGSQPSSGATVSPTTQGTGSSAAASALASFDSTLPVSQAEEQAIVGPLLAPLVSLGIVSPNLEAIYPDYISFLHAVFTSWTSVANGSSGASLPSNSSSTSLASGIVFGNASSPSSRRNSVHMGASSPNDAIAENVRTQVALGGLYLTLMQHGTTIKIPAISRCFATLQPLAYGAPGLGASDLDTLRKKVVSIYTDWVQTQPPSALLPAATVGTFSTTARRRSSGTSSAAVQARKNAGVLKLPVQNSTARVSKQRTSSFGEGKGSPSGSPEHAGPETPAAAATLSAETPAPAATTNLPAPCQKCFHNHKGNNCARKCYVCRMAKLAAQHGHIVELVTATPGEGSGTGSGPSTPTISQNSQSFQQPPPQSQQQRPANGGNTPQLPATPNDQRERSQERPVKSGIEQSRYSNQESQPRGGMNGGRNNINNNNNPNGGLSRNNSMRRPDHQRQMNPNGSNMNPNNNNREGNGGNRRNTHRRTYSAVNNSSYQGGQGNNFHHAGGQGGPYSNNFNHINLNGGTIPGQNSTQQHLHQQQPQLQQQQQPPQQLQQNPGERQRYGGHRKTQSTAGSKFGSRLHFDS